MDITLERHQLIDGLFVAVSGYMKIYFEYVGYDFYEKNLIFERNNEVVTGRIAISSDVQLDEWKKAFATMGIELEYLEDR